MNGALEKCPRCGGECERAGASVRCKSTVACGYSLWGYDSADSHNAVSLFAHVGRLHVALLGGYRTAELDVLERIHREMTSTLDKIRTLQRKQDA